ncbi:hypothetical protein HY745_02455 [Candidatus Desantisbacteria bacterium]|nr:hypothetical protein [Candidatus Desantisbacteria bacterium]
MISKKSIKEIKNLAKGILKLAEQAGIIYSQEVDSIISSGCRDKHRIECTLDGMLDFCFDKNMLKLYRKFCRYYYKIDKPAAVEYVNAYCEMWDPSRKLFGRKKLWDTQLWCC